MNPSQPPDVPTFIPFLDRGLGRLPAPDARDARFPMRRAVQMATQDKKPPPPYRYYRTPVILDQGSSPHCVAYTWRQILNMAPVMVKPNVGLTTDFIYAQAQLIDEWPGQDYDGTSVRAGAKVLAREGWIGAYWWATGAQQVADFLLSGCGPVAMGTNWYRGMSVPDERNFIKPIGLMDGGHAWTLDGYNDMRGVFRMVNSWGTSYGDGGRAYILGEHLDRLIKEDGEACAPTELRRKV